MIGYHPVDFFWHPPVEAAKTRLDMGHWNMKLCCRQSPGERRVGVPVNHDVVWLFFQQYYLNPLQHLGRLGPMRARANAEVVIGFRDVQLMEEHLAHVTVVVLPGMDQELSGNVSELPRDRSTFDKLWARPNNGSNLHG